MVPADVLAKTVQLVTDTDDNYDNANDADERSNGGRKVSLRFLDKSDLSLF